MMSTGLEIHRRGSVTAAYSGGDAPLLKVIVVNPDGKLLDSHGQFICPGADDSVFPSQLLEMSGEGNPQIKSKWTEGTLDATAFKHSDIAGCTFMTVCRTQSGDSKVNVAFSFFYQYNDGTIISQTLGRIKANVWDPRKTLHVLT